MTEFLSNNSELLLPFIIGFAFALLIVGLVGRTPAIFTRSFVRIIRLPFSILAVVFRIIRQRRLPRSLAISTLHRRRGFTSEIEKELRRPVSKNQESGEDGEDEHYDFTEEEKYFRRDGWFFKSIRVPEGYLPNNLTAKLTNEFADETVDDALRFFNGKVPTEIDGKALYEDAEGAVIISMFKRSDLRCFYALNEMRKTINRNALRVVALFSLFLFFAVYALWTVNRQEMDFIVEHVTLIPGGFLTFLEPILSFIILAIFWALLQFTHGGGYQKQQQNATRELGLLMNRYMDRINDRFRDARTNAMAVTVGEEKDTKKVSSSARKWFAIMTWMSFRAFFIESFFRNIKFQIERNKAYYLLIPWAVMIAGVLVLMKFGYANDFAKMEVTELVLLVSLIASALLYYYYINKEVIGLEIKQSNWFGFENLEVGHAMEEVVGKYAEEVGYWKNRLER